MSAPLPADERQQFEAWKENRPYGDAGEWAAWQAARAAVPVERDLMQLIDNYASLHFSAGCMSARGQEGGCSTWPDERQKIARAILALRAPVEDDRKVMEQALEALEEARGYVNSPSFSPSMGRDCNNAIAALRARLGGQTGSDGVKDKQHG